MKRFLMTAMATAITTVMATIMIFSTMANPAQAEVVQKIFDREEGHWFVLFLAVDPKPFNCHLFYKGADGFGGPSIQIDKNGQSTFVLFLPKGSTVPNSTGDIIFTIGDQSWTFHDVRWWVNSFRTTLSQPHEELLQFERAFAQGDTMTLFDMTTRSEFEFRLGGGERAQDALRACLNEGHGMD